VKIRAMTITLDRAVGTVIDGLNEQELLDNTLLIFVNDNGGISLSLLTKRLGYFSYNLFSSSLSIVIPHHLYLVRVYR
jgi:arylsulfatase A-like enzyme